MYKKINIIYLIYSFHFSHYSSAFSLQHANFFGSWNQKIFLFFEKIMSKVIFQRFALFLLCIIKSFLRKYSLELLLWKWQKMQKTRFLMSKFKTHTQTKSKNIKTKNATNAEENKYATKRKCSNSDFYIICMYVYNEICYCLYIYICIMYVCACIFAYAHFPTNLHLNGSSRKTSIEFPLCHFRTWLLPLDWGIVTSLHRKWRFKQSVP